MWPPKTLVSGKKKKKKEGVYSYTGGPGLGSGTQYIQITPNTKLKYLMLKLGLMQTRKQDN